VSFTRITIIVEFHAKTIKSSKFHLPQSSFEKVLFILKNYISTEFYLKFLEINDPQNIKRNHKGQECRLIGEGK
jgi:hypothetical protein